MFADVRRAWLLLGLLSSCYLDWLLCASGCFSLDQPRSREVSKEKQDPRRVSGVGTL